MFIINEPELAAHAMKVVDKLWGKEFWLVNSELYCCKILKIIPGYQSSIHAHTDKDETFIGIWGIAELQTYMRDAQHFESTAIGPGITHRIQPNTFHSFRAVNVSWVMEISTHHSDKDVIRLEESKRLEP